MVEGATEGDHCLELPSLFTEPRWRSGRSPSTPARCARTYPTFSHNATQYAHLLPLSLPYPPVCGLKAGGTWVFGGSSAGANRRPKVQSALHVCGLNVLLQTPGPC